MKKFYIHKDGQQQGPFTTDELKEHQITRDTMTWYEGAGNWEKAEEIEDLKELFVSIPPPLQPNPLIAPPPFVDKAVKTGTQLKVETQPKKNNKPLIVIISILLLVIIGTIIYVNQQAKRARIETEIQQQIQQQNMQLQEQNAKIQQQEGIEAARKAEATQNQNAAYEAQRAANLADLQAQYDNAVTNLRKWKIQLNDDQQFKLLRTPVEKQSQLDRDLEAIRNWEKECDRLQKEIGNAGQACFAKGTKISLVNGKTKNIECLLLGDTVSVYDFSNKKIVSSVIQKLEKVTHSNLVKYCFENGKTTIATQDHPIMLDKKGWASLNPIKSSQYLGFESIAKIKIGDNFITINQNNEISKSKLVKIEFLEGKYETYTISKSSFSDNFIANDLIVGVEVFESITLNNK